MTSYNPGDIVKYRYSEGNIGLIKIIGPGEDEDEYSAEWIEVPDAAAIYAWNKPGYTRYISTNQLLEVVTADHVESESQEIELVFDDDETDIIVRALMFAAQFNADEVDAIEALRLARNILIERS